MKRGSADNKGAKRAHKGKANKAGERATRRYCLCPRLRRVLGTSNGGHDECGGRSESTRVSEGGATAVNGECGSGGGIQAAEAWPRPRRRAEAKGSRNV